MTTPEQTPAPVPPPTPGAPAAPGRKSGVWQLVVGIVLVVLSLFNLPRGLIGVVVTATQEGMVSPAVPLGVAFFGLVLLAGGIVLIVWALRIRAANKAVGTGTAPPAV